MIRIFIAAVLILILTTGAVHAENDSGEMSVDLLVGENWIGIPGKLYDHNNVVIDSVSDFAAYLEYLDIVVSGDHIGWRNPCTHASESYIKLDYYPFWDGTDFDIYSGQGISINIKNDCVLPLKFEYISNNHTICGNKYCEIVIKNEECQTLEELLMEFGEMIMLLMLLYLNHTSKKKNLLLVAASVTYVTYLTVYVNVNEHMTLIGFYILILAYFVLGLLPQNGGK